MSVRPPRPRGIALSLFWLLLFTALSMGIVMVAAIIGLFVAAGGVGGVQDAIANLFSNVLGFSIVMAVLSLGMAAGITIFSIARDKRGLRALGLRSAGLRPGLAWFVALLAIHAPMFGLLALNYGAEVVIRNLWYLLAIMPFIVLQAGSEEVMFRGWLLPTVAARYGPMIGVIVSTIAFSAAHFGYGGDVLGMVMSVALRAPLGWALAVLALRHGNLGASIGVHTGLNTALFVFAQISADAEHKTLLEIISEQISAGSFDTPMESALFVLSCTQSILFPLLAVWWFSRKDLPRIFAKPAPALPVTD
ncbi:MAG: type II CAAX endopeptidase family protein [Alphaproteobacteria bacterium]